MLIPHLLNSGESKGGAFEECPGTEDGVTLLAGVVLIYLAGGVSGAGVFRNDVWWVFICLFLTVASWLWAPFIFNPYQLLQLQQVMLQSTSINLT